MKYFNHNNIIQFTWWYLKAENPSSLEIVTHQSIINFPFFLKINNASKTYFRLSPVDILIAIGNTVEANFSQQLIRVVILCAKCLFEYIYEK